MSKVKKILKNIQKHRSPLIAVCVILVVSLTVIAIARRNGGAVLSSSEITNWGLSFQTEGAPPIGNATIETLTEYDAFYCEKTEEKKIYLTFDAGFENGNMPVILDALKKHNVKATFFLVGHFFEQEPDLVRRMVEEGHTVGNHTYSHPDMSTISSQAKFEEELAKNEILYKEITGKTMTKLYRPPQGKFCVSNLEMAKELSYSTVFWSLAYVDWYEDKQPSHDEAFGKLIPRIHPGAIVLLHTTSKTNGEIMDNLLSKWTELGYQFGNLEELAAQHDRAVFNLFN